MEAIYNCSQFINHILRRNFLFFQFCLDNVLEKINQNELLIYYPKINLVKTETLFHVCNFYLEVLALLFP